MQNHTDNNRNNIASNEDDHTSASASTAAASNGSVGDSNNTAATSNNANQNMNEYHDHQKDIQKDKDMDKTTFTAIDIPDVEKHHDNKASAKKHHDQSDANATAAAATAADHSKRFAYQKSPLDGISFYNAVTASFMSPLIWLGYKRRIEVDDIWEPVEKDKTHNVVELLDKAWREELENAKQSNRQPSLFRAVFKVYGAPFMYTALSEAVYYGLQLTQPFALKALIQYVQPGSSKSKTGTMPNSIWYALALAGSVFACSFAINYKFYNLYRIGCRLRAALQALIYNKALTLSSGSRTTSTIGQTLNIVSNDTSRVFDACLFANTIFVSPVVLCVTLGLLGKPG